MAASASGQGKESSSSFMNYTCTSSPSKVPCLDNNAEPCNICDYTFQNYFDAGPVSEQVEETSGSSYYFSCASSPSKLPGSDDNGTPVTPVSMYLEQSDNSSANSDASCPFDSVNNNKPFIPLVPGRDERIMTIYYMPVQTKRGVAVLLDPEEEGLEPPPKKIKIEEITYIEKVHKNVHLSPMSMKKCLTEHDFLDSGAQEKGKNNDHPAEPSATEEYPRVKTPEWLVAQSSGFRCMACCRVFPSTVALQEHVEHGVKEGFSCHAFHLALAHLKHKTHKEEQHKIKKPTFRCQKEKHVGMKTTSY